MSSPTVPTAHRQLSAVQGQAAVANRLMQHARGVLLLFYFNLILIYFCRLKKKSGTTAPAVTRNKKTALLVDDVKVTLKVTSVALHQSGFVCESADDGEIAVQMAKKNQYNVILMDVQVMWNLEFLKFGGLKCGF
jgi:hypothetical protein